MTLEGIKKRSRGFTLIEALTVVSIIGVLAGLTIYSITQAQRQARDAKRKSDVVAINQGFEARYADKTCTETVYPAVAGKNVDGTYPWAKVSDISSLSGEKATDDCALSHYLPTLPEDPNTSKFPYIYNISTLDVGGVKIDGKHFRIAAHLERSQMADCAYQSSIWETTFGGYKYDCGSYAFRGKSPRYFSLLSVIKAEQNIQCSNCPATVDGGDPIDCGVWKNNCCRGNWGNESDNNCQCKDRPVGDTTGDCPSTGGGVCGDGNVDLGETCDGTSCGVGKTCSNCRTCIDNDDPTPRCGDGNVDLGEDCDGSACGAGKTCQNCKCVPSGGGGGDDDGYVTGTPKYYNYYLGR